MSHTHLSCVHHPGWEYLCPSVYDTCQIVPLFYEPAPTRWEFLQEIYILQWLQIEVFKILNGYENIDSNTFFKIKESKITRGHNFTPVKEQSRLDVRKY